MSLKHGILGLLSFKPQSGYELKANFSQSICFLWNADQAQIYRTLSELTKEGLVNCAIINQIGKPNKKIYELTKAGEYELKKWLSISVDSKGQHNTELLQIFFLGHIPNDEVIDSLNRTKLKIEKGLLALTSLETVSELFIKKEHLKRQQFFFHKTLKLGIMSAKLNIEWIDEMIKEIKSGEIPEE